MFPGVSGTWLDPVYINGQRTLATGAVQPSYFFEELVLGNGIGKLASGIVGMIKRVGFAAKGSTQGGLNLFKFGKPTTTTANSWRAGDRMLHLPNKGTPKLNWKQNSGFLRQEMSRGKPIFDSYLSPNGQQIPTGGFLNAERFLLESRGWRFNSATGAYHPPF